MAKKQRDLTPANRSPNDGITRIGADLPDRGAGADDAISILSIVCRICFDDDKEEPIITPCLCRGSVAFVHTSCLEKWLAESNTSACELCHHVYETEKVPRYTAKQSVWQWLRHNQAPAPPPQQQQPAPANAAQMRTRQIRCDLIACAILTPLAIIVTYICLFSADYYNQQRYASAPTARWTSLSLLVLIAIMLFGYYLWVYVVVGYHGRMWYYWWQRDWVLRYIQPPLPTAEERAAALAAAAAIPALRPPLMPALGPPPEPLLLLHGSNVFRVPLSDVPPVGGGGRRGSVVGATDVVHSQYTSPVHEARDPTSSVVIEMDNMETCSIDGEELEEQPENSSYTDDYYNRSDTDTAVTSCITK